MDKPFLNASHLCKIAAESSVPLVQVLFMQYISACVIVGQMYVFHSLVWIYVQMFINIYPDTFIQSYCRVQSSCAFS